MIELLKQFFTNHNITTHTFAAGFIFLTGLYVENVDFQVFVDASLINHPRLIALVGFSVFIYRNYANPRNRMANQRRTDPKLEEK